MNFSELWEEKRILVIIVGVIIIVALALGIFGIARHSNSQNNNTSISTTKKLKEDIILLKTDNIGKAIEIQALLAREGIIANRTLDGQKSNIILPKETTTMAQRDAALLAIVKSGLMDQNIGLEIFDKGDFTSTKEDKRIRLARAINGELARLIRKIPPIENASVFVSIPEQTMFTSQQKPITATVQISIPSGEKLDRTKVRAITNLVIGSVTGLDAKNVTISDTNGNVYSSIINASADIMERLEENDRYMQNKVQMQLDKLIGKGKYAVTVSTFLTQSPVEKTSLIYNPNSKTATSEQIFSEGLGDQTQDSNKSVNAVSVYLPNGLPNSNANSAQNRNYSRTAKETQYGVSKTQVNEYIAEGTIAEISIALTLDKSALPDTVTINELKDLIANAASPMANADNVTIAFSDELDPLLAGDRPVNLPKPDETGNPWWIAIVLLVFGLGGGLSFISAKVKQTQDRQRAEIETLRNKTQDQEKQLRDVNIKAAELIEKQSQLAQGLLEQQRQPQLAQQTQTQPQMKPQNLNDVKEKINEISSDIQDLDEEEIIEKVKSWIEQA